MAKPELRLPRNVAGDFYVDSTCIDCETCMIVAPEVFAESDEDLSYVHHQPATDGERRRALMALASCPTSSIGTLSRRNAAAAARAFPEHLMDDVYYCGFAAESSFGASSYFITRAGGNVLIDSPRAAGPLMRRLGELGGVSRLILTHQDDVADQARFHDRFGCERVIHAADAAAVPGAERVLQGLEPIALASDLLIIPVPGHSEGSVAILHRDILFSGDHLWGRADGSLGASYSVCGHSWQEQIRSVARLEQYDFKTILPGHGRRFTATSSAVMRDALGRLVDWMAGQPGRVR